MAVHNLIVKMIALIFNVSYNALQKTRLFVIFSYKMVQKGYFKMEIHFCLHKYLFTYLVSPSVVLMSVITIVQYKNIETFNDSAQRAKTLVFEKIIFHPNEKE